MTKKKLDLSKEQPPVDLDIKEYEIKEDSYKPFEEEEKPVTSKKWIYLIGAILSVVIILVVSTLKGQNIAPVEPEQEETNLVFEIPEEPDEVGNPPTFSNEGVIENDENKVTPEDDQDNEINQSKYAKYSNGYLGLSMEIPSSWYYEEKSSEALGILRTSVGDDGKFNIYEGEVSELMPIVSLYPSDKYDTRINLWLEPLTSTNGRGIEEGTLDKMIDVIDSSNSDGIELGGHVVKITPFTFTLYGQEYESVQMEVPLGVNNLLIQAHTNMEGDQIANLYVIIEHMIASLVFEEG